MKIILFDWNGTLLDDIPIWYASICEIFKNYGKMPPTIAEYFQELEGDYLKIYRSRGIEASRDEINAIYETHYESLIRAATLFPDVCDTLESIANKGIIMGLITAQKEFLVTPLLEKFGLSHLFKYCEFHVLDKQLTIRQILEKEKAAPQECCLVGDAPSDIRHAKKADIVSAAFFTHYIPDALLIDAEPHFMIFDFKDIINITEKMSEQNS